MARAHLIDPGVEFAHVDAAEAAHHEVGYRDPREAVRVAQRDAFVEARERRAHTARRVVRVGKPAQRPRDQRGIAQRPGVDGARFVRRPARRVVAARELHVAARRVELGQLAGEPVTRRDRLGVGEHRECLVDIRDQPMAGRETEQRTTPLARDPPSPRAPA